MPSTFHHLTPQQSHGCGRSGQHDHQGQTHRVERPDNEKHYLASGAPKRSQIGVSEDRKGDREADREDQNCTYSTSNRRSTRLDTQPQSNLFTGRFGKRSQQLSQSLCARRDRQNQRTNDTISARISKFIPEAQ